MASLNEIRTAAYPGHFRKIGREIAASPSLAPPKYADDGNWVGREFKGIRRFPSMKIGNAEQDFVERPCASSGSRCAFPVKADGLRKRRSPQNLRVEGARCEPRTESEDANGAFQFNHLRDSGEYDALLRFDIYPANICTAAWSKAEVATGMAGNTVSIEKDGSVSRMQTKKPSQMFRIADFEKTVRDLGKKLNDQSPSRANNPDHRPSFSAGRQGAASRVRIATFPCCGPRLVEARKPMQTGNGEFEMSGICA